MPLSSEQMSMLRLVMRSIGTVSVLLNVTLIACVVALKRFHKPMSFLQGLEVIQAIMYLIGNEIAKASPTTCFVVGISAQFFFSSVTFMTFIISLYVYLSILHRQGVAERYWYYYHGYTWGMSALFTGLLFVMEAVLKRGSVIGDATFECWISPSYPDLRINLFYVPLWIHSGFIFAMYARIFAFLRWHSKAKREQNIQTGIIPYAPETRPTSFQEGSSHSESKDSPFKVSSSHRASSNTSSVFVAGSAPYSTLPKARNTVAPKGGHELVKSILSNANKKLLVKAGVMALGFVVSWVPASTGRVLALFPSVTAPFWLTILTGVGLSSCGLWNSGIFFLTWFWPTFSKFYSSRAANAILSTRLTNASEARSGSGI
ncbi:hypothetical protein BJ741DRAFT_649091 [Chytriomyces cf. hyalinus JEL632]|nr:hypothetical protein BJ741DRAFT_649091 [Chytriomyces cf. hyalinus JEL632]